MRIEYKAVMRLEFPTPERWMQFLFDLHARDERASRFLMVYFKPYPGLVAGQRVYQFIYERDMTTRYTNSFLNREEYCLNTIEHAYEKDMGRLPTIDRQPHTV